MPLALIVGAGIGGLASALALRRAGWDARVVERTAAARELGFGIALARNAVDALIEIGLADAVLPHTVPIRSAEVRAIDGRVVRNLTPLLGSLPAEVRLPRIVLRQTLHRALLTAVGEPHVATGRQAVGCRSDGRGACVQFADGTSMAADIVVGADGIHSIVRSALHPAEPPLAPSGYFALRGASPAVDALGGLDAVMYYGPGIECGVVRAAVDRIYWFFSLRADDIPTGSASAEDVLRRWLPRFDPQFRAIAEATPSDQLRLDELLTRRPIREWGRDRVTLLGDAAHPMLPHTAQGAAQALEDAAGLGRALQGGGDPVAALRRYEGVRARRTAAVVRSGPRIAAFAMARHPLLRGARAALIRHVPTPLVVAFVRGAASDPNRALGVPLTAARDGGLLA